MPSKLEKLQLQFRQRLMQEKEERMIKIHTDNQQKALSKISKYNGNENHAPLVLPKQSQVISTSRTHSPVKKSSPGVDRSRPLPPISKEQRNNFGNRISPDASLNEEPKSITANPRSKTFNLELKQTSTRVTQNGKVLAKNGNSKAVDVEVRSQTMHQVQEKQGQDLFAKKQAELQRINVNSKVNEGAVPKKSNGINKSSNSQITTTKSYITPTSKPRAKLQLTGSNIQKFDNKSRSTTRNPLGNKTNLNGNSSNKALPRKPPGPGQEQCNHCGRNFNQDRIAKHITICSKTSQKKVKVFDATKMRTQGTEAEAFVRKGISKAANKKKSSDWRKQHTEFIETIRQAKIAQKFLAAGGNARDLPPPPPSDTSHYIQCPHCNRKFNEGVAERHIPKCKNILSNKKGPTNIGARRK